MIWSIDFSWLVEFSTKAAVLLGAARVAAYFLRHCAADVRHRLWLAALAGVAILALPVRFPQPVTIAVPVQFSVTTLSIDLPARVSTGVWPLWSAIWIAGILAALAKLLAGVTTVALWTRRARRIDRVLISDLAATPLTWGVFRPVILFPACAAEWSSDQLDLVLRHEQAHVARRDWLWQMLANVLNAVFWFHPLVWMANAELRREAEGATDDMVLASGVDATDYAAQLVRVARYISGSLPLAVVPMARGRILESRVREILNPIRRRGQASYVTRAIVSVLACGCLVPLLALRQESVSRAVRIAATPLAPAPPQLAGVSAAALPTRPESAPAQLASAPAKLPANVPAAASAPVIASPRVLYKVEPKYTEDARAAKVQGSVRLNVSIDELGRPAEIKVVLSLDPGLDQEAVEAVRQWQFSPAMKDGVPISIAANIEVNFRLL